MSRLRPKPLSSALALLLWLIVCLDRQPPRSASAAQAGQPPETTVYVVQSGDTLYDIAERFDLAVEELATANGIDDPAVISIGQRLVIPPPSAVEVSLTHAVRAGETLQALSLRYGISAQDIAEDNHLIRADRMFVGQAVVVYGYAGEPSPLRGNAHTLSPGETLVGLAAENHVAPWLLAEENMQRSPYAPVAARHLWLAGEEGEFVDWPEPFSGFAIHPIPAMQGESVSVQISVTLPVTLSGSLMGTPLVLHSDPGGGVAVNGIDALAEPGLYTLAVTATANSGIVVRYVQPIPIVDGEYASEDISVAPEIAQAMTPDVVQAEAELLDQLFSSRTSRQWDGLFALPVVGDVTSAFGTRRTYNVAEASPYHTGTDFGTPVGTPVYAPADGRVVYAESLTVRGDVVIVDHGWGVLTGYWHLSSIHVSAGDEVSLGQHIADTGSSGLSTGPHLHWEMRVGNVPVSPLQWVREGFP